MRGGLYGLKAAPQNLAVPSKKGGARSLSNLPIVATSGSGSVTALFPCEVLLYGIGGGGSGGSSTNPTELEGAGGGAAAVFKRLRMSKGQTVSYSVGAGGAASNESVGSDGGDTTFTLPGGQVVIAGGGKAGAYQFTGLGGAGGVARNGDLNRPGGRGGSGDGTAGQDGGLGGGAGASATSPNSGGGGAAGFGDLVSGLTGGAGSPNGAGNAPGGGSYGRAFGAPGAVGGAGIAVIVMVRTS